MAKREAANPEVLPPGEKDPAEGTSLAVPGAEVGLSVGDATVRDPLIRLAIEKGLPAETLERLVALSERMSDREAKKEFARALADFQSTVKAIPKTKKVDYVGRTGTRVTYTFAPLDAIVAAIRPRLVELGFSFTWDASVVGTVVKAVCTLRHVNGHHETSTFEAKVDTGSKMNDSQQVAAALTYAKRYALIDVLGLTTTEPDTDANGPADERISESKAADLRSKCQEVGPTAEAGLLAYVSKIAGREIASLDDLPAAYVKAAFVAIEAKARGGAR